MPVFKHTKYALWKHQSKIKPSWLPVFNHRHLFISKGGSCMKQVPVYSIWFYYHHAESAENETKRKLDLSEGSGLVKEESLEIKEDPEHLEALSALQLSIRQVREGPPCLPSICFYTFINAYQGYVYSLTFVTCIYNRGLGYHI